MNKFCHKCKKETTHRKLKQLNFLTQCLIAGITNFGIDFREPSYECNNCGTRTED